MLIKKKRKSLIIPKVSKFKKQFKGVLTSFETKKTATNIYYGTFGIKVLKNGRLRLKHVETLRKLILRYIKKYETLWIRNVPNIPISKKPKEIRMGKGKGNTEYWALRIKAGHILFEISQMRVKRAQKIFVLLAKKMALPCALIFNKFKIKTISIL